MCIIFVISAVLDYSDEGRRATILKSISVRIQDLPPPFTVRGSGFSSSVPARKLIFSFWSLWNNLSTLSVPLNKLILLTGWMPGQVMLWLLTVYVCVFWQMNKLADDDKLGCLCFFPVNERLICSTHNAPGEIRVRWADAVIGSNGKRSLLDALSDEQMKVLASSLSLTRHIIFLIPSFLNVIINLGSL